LHKVRKMAMKEHNLRVFFTFVNVETSRRGYPLPKLKTLRKKIRVKKIKQKFSSLLFFHSFFSFACYLELQQFLGIFKSKWIDAEWWWRWSKFAETNEKWEKVFFFLHFWLGNLCAADNVFFVTFCFFSPWFFTS
jgi:hypothetical protein